MDYILFFFLGAGLLSSCAMMIKKYQEDMQRFRELSLQVVPAVEVVEGVPVNINDVNTESDTLHM